MVSWVDWGGGSWIKLEQLGRTWKNWVKKVCWPGHEPGMTWFLDFEPILRCSCCVSLRSQDVLKWQRQHQYVKTMCVSFCFFLTNGFLVLLFERPLHFGTCCNRLNASSCASQEMHHIYLTLCQEIGCFLSQQITFLGGIWWNIWILGTNCFPEMYARRATMSEYDSDHYHPKNKIVVNCHIQY